MTMLLGYRPVIREAAMLVDTRSAYTTTLLSCHMYSCGCSYVLPV